MPSRKPYEVFAQVFGPSIMKPLLERALTAALNAADDRAYVRRIVPVDIYMDYYAGEIEHMKLRLAGDVMARGHVPIELPVVSTWVEPYNYTFSINPPELMPEDRVAFDPAVGPPAFAIERHMDVVIEVTVRTREA